MAIRPSRNSMVNPSFTTFCNACCTTIVALSLARMPRTVDPVERRAQVATAARAVIARDGLARGHRAPRRSRGG